MAVYLHMFYNIDPANPNPSTWTLTFMPVGSEMAAQTGNLIQCKMCFIKNKQLKLQTNIQTVLQKSNEMTHDLYINILLKKIFLINEFPIVRQFQSAKSVMKRGPLISERG